MGKEASETETAEKLGEMVGSVAVRDEVGTSTARGRELPLGELHSLA